MMLKVGLTGASGFIGSNFMKIYGDKYKFVPISSRRGLDNRFVYCDYSIASFESVFRGCDVIVHGGAKVQSLALDIGEIEEYNDNLVTTQNMLEAMHNLNIQKLVGLSSVYVYNENGNIPFVENSVLMPMNSYGISKAGAEFLMNLYSKKAQIDVTILRLSQVMGRRDYQNKGFFSMLSNNSRKGLDITLFSGTESSSRDYVYIKDVCRAIDMAIESNKTGIYNIGGGEAVSNMVLAQAYNRAHGNKSAIKIVGNSFGEDNRYWYMNIDKAKEKLGWVPQYSIYDMIDDIEKNI